MTYISNHMMTKQQEMRLLEIFKKLDENNDGTLTLEELKDGFQCYLQNEYMSEYDFEEIMKKVDTNQNGQIDYSEFIMSACQYQDVITDVNLKIAFDLFDLDQNGEITPLELKHVLSNNKNNDEIVDDEWERLLSEFDQNGDGSISFSEFKQMMLKLHEQQHQDGQGLAALLG